ncbi:neuronal acetylcholine receptor subunit alpha-7-like [Glandiceps talaboti]
MISPWSRLFLSILVVFFYPKGSLQGSHERRLLDKLLTDYNNLVRPVINDTDPIVVQLGLTLQQIIDLDEKNQILTANIWMRVYWYDNYLTWDPAQYGNITSVRIPPESIWIPDILLYNSADERFDGMFPTNVLISHEGLCQYIPPGIIKSTCKIDIQYFPFDEQMCHLKFGSWTYDGFKMDLQKLYEEGDVSSFISNGEWDLIGVPVNRNEFFYPCCPEPYPDITFIIHIRRRTLYYGFNLIIPCALMTLMAVVGFTLPPESGEKITLGITILLSMTVFLLLIAETMPPTSEVVPLVAKYYGFTMLMVGLSVIFTIISLNFYYRNPEDANMPKYMRAIFIVWLPWLLSMHRKKGTTNQSFRKTFGQYESYDNVKTIDLEMNEFRAPPRGEKQEKVIFSRYRQSSKNNEEIKPMVAKETLCNGHATMAKSRNSDAILRELTFITDHMRKEEEEAAMLSDWKFACIVMDRLCLYVFLVFTTIISFVIIFAAPNARQDLTSGFQ